MDGTQARVDGDRAENQTQALIESPASRQPRPSPAPGGEKPGRPAGTTSSVDLFEVEISQIHVAIRQYVYGENVFPSAETNFEKLRRQIPMVPLTPTQPHFP